MARGFRGGERQTELLIRELAKQGYRQCLIARSDEPLIERMGDVPGLELRSAPTRFGALLRSGGTTLIHAHEAKAAQVAWLNRSLRRTPYVVTRRVDRPPRRFPFALSVNRRASVVVALSNAIQDLLQAADPGLDVHIIPSAGSLLIEDTTLSAALEQQFAGKFVIGHVGALVDKHKGQSTLIEALRQLDDLEDLVLVLVGSGTDRPKFEAAASGLPIVFTGHVDDVGSYLGAMDLFAFPSNNEGLGSILIDAMSAGLPIVASRVGGIPELVEHEANGILVEPGRPDQLAAGIRRLYQDPTLCNAMGENNRDRAQDYSPANMARRYLEIYQQALSGSSK